MKERILLGVCVLLFVMLFFIGYYNYTNYEDLLGIVDNYILLTDDLKRTQEEVVKAMQSDYSELERDYIELKNDYSELENDYTELLDEKEQLVSKLNEVEIPIYEYTEEEIYLLAQCVEAEAGHYAYAPNSQRYVTQVILNRLHSGEFPNTIEEVIYHKTSSGVPQFSVAYNGMMEREVEPETLANVYSVLIHGTDLPEYVCYFYSTRLTKDCWLTRLDVYTECEGTKFAYENMEE